MTIDDDDFARLRGVSSAPATEETSPPVPEEPEEPDDYDEDWEHAGTELEDGGAASTDGC